MTSELKCPFCQQELRKDPDGYYSCYTDNCSVMSAGGNGASGTESLWQELTQAKQDLEIATKALEKYADEDMWETGHRWEVDYIQALFLEHGYEIAKEALEQINRKRD